MEDEDDSATWFGMENESLSESWEFGEDDVDSLVGVGGEDTNSWRGM